MILEDQSDGTDSDGFARFGYFTNIQHASSLRIGCVWSACKLVTLLACGIIGAARCAPRQHCLPCRGAVSNPSRWYEPKSQAPTTPELSNDEAEPLVTSGKSILELVHQRATRVVFSSLVACVLVIGASPQIQKHPTTPVAVQEDYQEERPRHIVSESDEFSIGTKLVPTLKGATTSQRSTDDDLSLLVEV